MGMIVVPEKIVRSILGDLRAALKSGETSGLSVEDALLRQGMVEGLNFLEGKIDTWITHQRNLQKMKARSVRRLVTKNVTLSNGRYRKFEWYQGKRFISLAFRWGRDQADPEIGLQI